MNCACVATGVLAARAFAIKSPVSKPSFLAATPVDKRHIPIGHTTASRLIISSQPSDPITEDLDVVEGSVILPAMAPGARLLLREWTSKDAQALSEAVQRNIEHLRPWMPWVAQEPLRANERLALINVW